jgi:hypothetical protein
MQSAPHHPGHATVVAPGDALRAPGGLPGADRRLGGGRGTPTPQTIATRPRLVLAWLCLLIAGMAMALTGQVTWRIGGHEVYGEYVVEFLALGAAGFALLVFGLRSLPELIAARVTLGLALVSPITAAWSSDWYWSAELLLHLAIVGQLAAWGREARRMGSNEAWPVGVMFAGMAVEAVNIAWKMTLGPDVPAGCDAAFYLSCTASPHAAMALPLLMTLAMVPWWLGIRAPWRRRS